MNASRKVPTSICVLDARGNSTAQFEQLLSLVGYDAVRCSTGYGPTNVAENVLAVALSGVRRPSDIQETLEMITGLPDHVPLLVGGEVSEAQILTSIETRRPIWFIGSPVRRERLLRLLQRAARFEAQQVRHLITGESSTARRIRTLIERISDCDTTVLITGESGTGKELIARSIHNFSHRASGRFVPINCAAIPAELLESELFGHEKGAFTGAISAKAGRFELADGGTLFLDEIGDMPVELQVRLLRVLQEREFERVGSNESRTCNVRIVAATNRDLAADVRDGRFREDLFYRLNVLPVVAPSLRARADDIPGLVQEIAAALDHERNGLVEFDERAIRVLRHYSWPGNVRQLGNLVERLAITHGGKRIGEQDLPADIVRSARDRATEEGRPSNDMDFSESQPEVTEGFSLKRYLDGLERDLIERALDETNNVVAHAATLLNLRRTTLVQKLLKYDFPARRCA